MKKIKESWIARKYIAHRGLHNDTIIENTLLAFQKAVDLGYAIELDVHRIVDGNIVVFHDYNLKRLTGLDEAIENLDIESIKKLKLLNTNQTIPTLEEVLNLVHGKTPILIEIKSENFVGRLEESLWQILKKYEGEYAVQSFNPISVYWFKKNAPYVYRGQLSYNFKDEPTLSKFKKGLLRKMRLNIFTKPHFIAYGASDLPIKHVNRKRGVVLAWTVTSQKEHNRIKSYCDNIIFENFIPE